MGKKDEVIEQLYEKVEKLQESETVPKKNLNFSSTMPNNQKKIQEQKYKVETNQEALNALEYFL